MRRALAGLALALGVAGAGCGGGASPEGPSVLLVSIDTLRADHVGAYGAEAAHTPVLDALAVRGVRFETVIAATPLTLPSHASLLTGQHPPRHGVRHNGLFRLDASAETLAARFRSGGWRTGAVVAAFVLDGKFGLASGFDHYDDAVTARVAAPGGFHERRADAVTDAALAWLAEEDDPFLLWVHYYDPHREHDPPEPWASRFAADPYAGEIAFVDEQLGRLLAGARAADPEVLVAVTADHGESLGEHGELTHGYSLYDAALRVPLILAGPGLPEGRTVDGVVGTVDLAPTLLGVAGLAPLAEADGRDLSPRWSAAGDLAVPEPRAAYAETLATRYEFGWSPLHALRTDEHLYVKAPRPELYALASDPGQLHDLLAAGEASATPTAEHLAVELERIVAMGRDAPPAELDPASRERLRALGYLLPERPTAESAIDPKDGLALLPDLWSATAAIEAGDPARARPHLERVIAAAPESAHALTLLSGVERLAGRPDLALRHAERAAALVPDHAMHHVLVGDARVALADLAGAVAAYREALERDPELAEAHAGLMWGAVAEREPARAEPHAERALALLPESAELQARVASVWDRLGEYERALAGFERSAELDPGAPTTWMQLAIQYARFGRAADSEAALARAGGVAQDPGLRNRLAIAWAARGETGRAEAIFRELLERDPAYANARRNLAHLLRQSGRAEEAARVESGA